MDGSAGRKAIDNTEVKQPEVHIRPAIETVPVFVRAGSIVPEQPLVQSTEEKPQGPLTLRVYPPTATGRECSGSVYLDDGVSYSFKKGEFLREGFTCHATDNGLTVTIAPREGSFKPWWSMISIEVYGATKGAEAQPCPSWGVPRPRCRRSMTPSIIVCRRLWRTTGKDWNCSWHTEVVFTLTKPSSASIIEKIEAARGQPPDVTPLFSLFEPLAPERLPTGFAHDHSRSCLGRGEAVFAAAKGAFARWVPFNLGWVEVVNRDAPIVSQQIVAVQAQTLGLWPLNLSRITDTDDTERRFGFIYATTLIHVEQGEERFVLNFDQESAEVSYEIEAISRPRSPLARIGFPVTRAFQHRFARDSHRRMRQAVAAGTVL